MKIVTAIGFGFAMMTLGVGGGYVLAVNRATTSPPASEGQTPASFSERHIETAPSRPSQPAPAPLPTEGTVSTNGSLLGCKNLYTFTSIMTAVNADDNELAGVRIRTGLASGACRQIKKGENVFVHHRLNDHYACIRGSSDADCLWTLITVIPFK